MARRSVALGLGLAGLVVGLVGLAMPAAANFCGVEVRDSGMGVYAYFESSMPTDPAVTVGEGSVRVTPACVPIPPFVPAPSGATVGLPVGVYGVSATVGQPSNPHLCANGNCLP